MTTVNPVSMATPVPKIVIAKADKHGATNGVLPISASATQKASQHGGNLRPAGVKSIGPRLKVVIRRLPPGLTEEELSENLGPEWKVGGERVDWMVYKPGKMSQDPAKLSRPSRAYMHVTDQNYLVGLSEKVRQITIRDAKGTWNSSSSLGPPSVEFAPYGRIPSTKRRNDARQGTIDQDPEFIAFLEELTNPLPAKKSVDDEKKEGGEKKEDVNITPLVQFLKAKKAAKGKKPVPTGALKSDVSSAEKKPLDSREISISPRKTTQRGKVDATTKEVKEVKEFKQIPRDTSSSPRNSKTVPSSKPPTLNDPKAVVTSSTPPRGPAAARKRERGNVSIAARILQRDLGLGGDVGRRRGHASENSTLPRTGGQNPAAANTTAVSSGGASKERSSEQASSSVSAKPVESNPPSTEEKKASSVSEEVTQSSQSRANTRSPVAVLKKELSTVQVPTGPAASRTPRKNVVPSTKGTTSSIQSNTPASTTSGQQQQDTPSPKSSTQAFLKHANPSQGITEPVLKQAMEAFGEVNKAEIDKKKGFAYVDFAQPDGLQRALQASPIKIAEGQVVVLERKPDRGSTTGGGVRGGGVNRGGRGGGANYGPGSGSPRGGGGRGSRGGRGGFSPRGGTGATTGIPSPQPTTTSVESTGGTGPAG